MDTRTTRQRFAATLAAAAACAVLASPVDAQTPQTPPATETAVPAPGMGGTGSGPNGATLRCKDGSYPAPGAADSACDGKGGVLVRFPVRRAPELRAAGEARTEPAAVRQAREARARQGAAPDTTPPEGFVPWRDRRARAAEEATAARMPAGATMRCADGTWIVRDTTSSRCAPHRGVELRIGTPAQPSVRPPAPRPNARPNGSRGD
jgi:hypothetical protein